MINYLNKLMLDKIDHKLFNSRINKKIKEFKTLVLKLNN